MTNNNDNTVSIIDTASTSVIASIAVGLAPAGVAVTPNGRFAYVTNQRGNTVSVISAASNTVVATIPVATFPREIAITPDGALAYVTGSAASNITVIDTATNTVVGAIPISSPFSIALIDRVEALVASGALTQAQGAGLLDKIQEISAKIDAGKTSAACNQLSSFINQVNAFISNGTLTTADGQWLIDRANVLKTNLGC